jgi:membrane protein implicated in regulation of membrane protease activity
MWIAFWLVVVLLAAIGEIFTFDLFLGSVAVAALITAGLAAVLLPITVQAVAFGALSLVGIVLVRPALKRTLGIGSLAQEQNSVTHSHLQGRQGIVTQAIDTGEDWSVWVRATSGRHGPLIPRTPFKSASVSRLSTSTDSPRSWNERVPFLSTRLVARMI